MRVTSFAPIWPKKKQICAAKFMEFLEEFLIAFNIIILVASGNFFNLGKIKKENRVEEEENKIIFLFSILLFPRFYSLHESDIFVGNP